MNPSGFWNQNRFFLAMQAFYGILLILAYISSLLFNQFRDTVFSTYQTYFLGVSLVSFVLGMVFLISLKRKWIGQKENSPSQHFGFVSKVPGILAIFPLVIWTFQMLVVFGLMFFSRKFTDYQTVVVSVILLLIGVIHSLWNYSFSDAFCFWERQKGNVPLPEDQSWKNEKLQLILSLMISVGSGAIGLLLILVSFFQVNRVSESFFMQKAKDSKMILEFCLNPAEKQSCLDLYSVFELEEGVSVYQRKEETANLSFQNWKGMVEKKEISLAESGLQLVDSKGERYFLLSLPVSEKRYFVQMASNEHLEGSAVELNEKNTLALALALVGMIGYVSFSLRTRFASLSYGKSSLEEFEKGNFETKVRSASSDEIGKILVSLELFRREFIRIIEGNQRVALELSHSVTETKNTLNHIATSAMDTAESSSEITSGVQKFATNTEIVESKIQFQRSNIQNLDIQMENLKTLIVKMSDEVEVANQKTIQVTEHAEGGSRSLEKMKTSLTEIEGSSKQITQVIQIINEISDQINLLALNASIEAARAGEYGRGFSVVASEISKLAEKTANSLKDISSLIKKNEKEIKNGASAITETISVLTQIISDIQSFSTITSTLKKQMLHQMDSQDIISQEKEKIVQISEDVANVAGKQKLELGSIVEAIQTINETNQRNAAEVEELTANTEGISQKARELKDLVSRFKIG